MTGLTSLKSLIEEDLPAYKATVRDEISMLNSMAEAGAFGGLEAILAAMQLNSRRVFVLQELERVLLVNADLAPEVLKGRVLDALARLSLSYPVDTIGRVLFLLAY